MYNQAKTFGKSPAEMLGIPYAWLGWMVDNATFTFGAWVESQLAERDRDGKPVHRIETLLDIPVKMRQLHISQWRALGMEE